MTKKKRQDEDALFKEATRGVKPLKVNKVLALPKKKSLRPRSNRNDSNQDEKRSFYFSTEGEMEEISINQPLSFMKSGLQKRRFRQLKQGKIPVKATLDLHGLTSDPASEAVSVFIEESVKSHFHCVLIVHGKGGRTTRAKPVLKTKLNSWLKQHPAVIAFCSAIAKDGGTGAVYVLLKSGNW